MMRKQRQQKKEENNSFYLSTFKHLQMRSLQKANADPRGRGCSDSHCIDAA